MHKRPSPFSNTGAPVVFHTIAALVAYDDSSLEEGSLVYVRSIRSYWTKVNGENPGVADGITNVRNQSNNATWLRLDVRSPAWEHVVNWFIDPANGSDENLGTANAPIATWAEFQRRVRNLAVTMTVTNRSSINEPILGTFHALFSGLDLIINGVPTVIVDAGSDTTFSNPVTARGACAQGTMTSAAVPNFAPHVGRFLIAADGFVTPILGANGAAPILSTWTTPFYDNDKPADGTRVDIVTLTEATSLQLTLSGGLGLSVNYLRFTGQSYGEAVNVMGSPAAGSIGIISFFACDFGGPIATTFFTYYMACQLSGAEGFLPILDYSTSMWMGGGSRDRSWDLYEGGHTQFQGFIIQGGYVEVGFSDHQSNPSSIGLWGVGLGLGVFNAPKDGVTVAAAASVTGKSLYGAGNAGYGLNVLPGGRVNVLSRSTITGTSGDFLFDGAATAIPPLVGGAAVPAAQPLTTWVQHEAPPFNDRVVSYRNGACLCVG